MEVTNLINGLAEKYNGNLKTLLLYSSKCFSVDESRPLCFGRLVETKVMARSAMRNIPERGDSHTKIVVQSTGRFARKVECKNYQAHVAVLNSAYHISNPWSHILSSVYILATQLQLQTTQNTPIVGARLACFAFVSRTNHSKTKSRKTTKEMRSVSLADDVL
eukprot:718143-Amphidinium_carterae.1